MDARENLYIQELKHYKFYLSFENSLCRDYITEKFFLALLAGAVPIVYGGLSPEDYLKVITNMIQAIFYLIIFVKILWLGVIWYFHFNQF